MLGTISKCCTSAAQTSLQEIRRSFSKAVPIICNGQFTIPTNNKANIVRNGGILTFNQNILNRQLSNLRTLSTFNTPPIPLAITGTVATKDESRDFMAVFPDVVRDLTEAGRHLDIPEATKWFAKVLQYNVPGGKKNRGLATVYAFRMLAPKDQLTAENIRLSLIMGWCIEMFQAFFLVLDDIMDNSITRRGRPCWYRNNNLGIAAVNDGILMENGLYQLLRRYFRDKPYYVHVMELFHDFLFISAHSSEIEYLSTHKRKAKFRQFTMNRYNSIVKYKTAYSSFHLPVALAMYMAGYMDEEMHRQAKTILLERGPIFSVHNEYYKTFRTGICVDIIGTDIEDGKCTL
ncbi:hypothetical protein L9F63_027849, partial [Diploptera punctata]